MDLTVVADLRGDEDAGLLASSSSNDPGHGLSGGETSVDVAAEGQNRPWFLARDWVRCLIDEFG